jgi:hypothetical protein
VFGKNGNWSRCTLVKLGAGREGQGQGSAKAAAKEVGGLLRDAENATEGSQRRGGF